MATPDFVTFRDLHELLEKQSDRIGRLEKVVVAVLVAVASPKLGGPDLSQVVAAAVAHFA